MKRAARVILSNVCHCLLSLPLTTDLVFIGKKADTESIFNMPLFTLGTGNSLVICCTLYLRNTRFHPMQSLTEAEVAAAISQTPVPQPKPEIEFSSPLSLSELGKVSYKTTLLLLLK